MNNRERWSTLYDKIQELEQKDTAERQRQLRIQREAAELWRWIGEEPRIGDSTELENALRLLASDLDGDDQQVFQAVVAMLAPTD